ncbi:MAG: thioredoxin [Acidimicrobiia bacterium]|nr:thioredoxin [Acidimicrobiia bacterium]
MQQLYARVSAGVIVMGISACSTSAQPARQPARTPAPTEIVARYGDATLTLGEVDARALSQPTSNFGSMRLADALYEARRAAIDDIINIRLVEREAKAQGIEVAPLLEREITHKVVPPTELDVAAWYKANPQRVNGAAIEQVRDPIRNLLMQERSQEARRVYLDSLRAKLSISVSLDPPRVQIDAAGRPTRGPNGAPIEIVEFSDFQCPFCLSAFPTVQKVLQIYGDKIRFTYRHYPLQNHPNARPAAEASACAAEQGKFWEYHDRLFTDQSKLSQGDLRQHAAALGLNAINFNDCLESKRFARQVDEDVDAGNKVGVNGTPAFFINGRILSGAQPFDAFKRIIDEELAAQ